MKIVQVIPDFSLGGIQKAGCVLAQGVAGHGHQSAVFGRVAGPRFETDPGLGVTHHVVEGGDGALAQAVLDSSPDAIHIHAGAYEERLVRELHARGARIDGRPLVVSTPVFGRPPGDRALLGMTRTAVVGSYMLYRLRHWMGLSLEAALEAGVVVTPVVSYQATDPPISTLDPPEVRAERRREFGIPADAFVVGRIGRDADEKWSPANVELIDRLLGERDGAVWLSIGYPAIRDREGLARRWGDRFIALPQSADYGLLSRAFASMDVQVFFSCWGECFAATLCEAAGVALPTVAGVNPLRDNGQSEQVVEGVTGHLVADVDGALAHLDRLAADPAELESLQRSTQAYAAERWTPEQIAAELIALCEAWLGDDPMATSRFQRMHHECRAFEAGYRPRVVGLLADGPLARLKWEAKLAAVRSWTAFRLGGKLKRFIR